MNTRRSFLSIVGLAAAAALITSATAGPETQSATAKIGAPAPNFKLKDANGKDHSLADFKGKIVVLQWINPQCPYCVRVTSKGVVSSMMKESKALDPDVVFLAVNSTNWMSADDSATYLKKHEIKMTALDDHKGTVGRQYGAKTTPHVFVIDDKGVLRYSGAIDDNPRGANNSAKNHVVTAIKQIKAGETVAPDQTRPYGCSVKYAKK